MAYIGSFPADKTTGAMPRDEFTGDGSTTSFTLSQEVPGGFESNVVVVVENVLQRPVDSYTITGLDNKTLVFSEAPESGTSIYVVHQGNATYNMIPVVGSVTPDKLSENLRTFTVDTFTGDASTTAFTLTATPISANSVLVFVDGIMQTKTTNYTVSGTTLTFTGAPDNGSAITVVHLGFSTVSRTAFADGSVTTAMIADNAITSAKIAFDVVVAEDIAANAITVAELQNGAVTPAKLSTGGPTWDTSSNVGIGAVASTSNRLRVTATAGNSPLQLGNDYGDLTLNIAASGGNSVATLSNGGYSSNNGVIAISTGGAERVRVDSSGKLGVGTNSPSSTIHAKGTVGQIRIESTDATGNSNLKIDVNTAANRGWQLFQRYTNGDIGFYDTTGGTDKWLLSSNGYMSVPYQPLFVAGINSGSDSTYSSGSPIVYNTILNSNSSTYNRSGSYSTSTGRFTAPIAGLYNFFWMTYFTNSGGNTISMQTAIYLNGNTQSSSGDAYGVQPVTPNSTGGTIGLCHTALLYLSAGDYVTIQPRSTIVRIYNGHSYFGGYLVG